MKNKRIKKNINGILLLDKSIGLSSNSALQHVKYLFGAKKAGHTGSLDPLATGMLPICFGEATKFSQYLLDSDKQYRATVKLGIKTSTGDAEGEVIAERPVENITPERLVHVLQQFIGTIQQIPPMHSAVKINGKPLYELARRGLKVERAARSVHIYALQYDGLQEDMFNLNVKSSKGTYIRTLVEDIGEQLGCGAHVSQLRRVSVSSYQHAKMYTFAALEEICQQYGEEALGHLLLPVESSVESLPAINLSTSAAFYLRTGQAVMVPHLPTQGFVRLYDHGGFFIGIGEISNDGRVTPRRLVA